MAELRTRLILRNDSTENWGINSDIVLLKGETGLEFLPDGKVKMKIGDGVKAWADLDYFGGDPIISDDKSIIIENNVVKLLGFEGAAVGAQPRKNADGIIEWVVPSTDTVDGLQATVAGLKSDVTNLQTNVTEIREILIPSEEGADTLVDRVKSLENKVGEEAVSDQIDSKLNEFMNRITDDGTVNTLKELIDYVANHGPEAADMAADIKSLQDLVGEVSVNEQIMAAIGNSGHIDEVKAKAIFEHVKYEISHKPDGALVRYRDDEIRVMCPTDTQWGLQNSGANADANSYYIGVKAYAPDGAVSFKEDTKSSIEDNTMHFFEGEFAGVDSYGRKYSIFWLPVANYNVESDAWTYYGSGSGNGKYIGWYYCVEWYDANGELVDSDKIRINLSNESCHDDIVPFYLSNALANLPVASDTNTGAVMGSADDNKVSVAGDGTMEINSVSTDKLVQGEDSLILNGGSAII